MLVMFKQKNIPNILTFSRLLCCPIWLILFYFDYYYLSLILVIYSAISDYLDGFLARKLNSISKIGKTLDPIADKIFTCTVLITFISDSRANFIIVSLIIIRELIVSGLREALAIYNHSQALNVTLLSKLKTAFQFIAIFILTLMPLSIEYSLKIYILGSIFLYLTALLTIYTGYKYVIKSIIILKKMKKE
jgi:CDP-diacylglycerol--glycerol-3-phosphate 3-phosphatidyltransferase